MAVSIDHRAGGLPASGEQHVAEPDAVRSREQCLWLAVVYRCWLDAFGDVKGAPGGHSREDQRHAADLERAEARRWLVWRQGDYAADRAEVCDLAGVDADALRDAAKRKLAAIRADEPEPAAVVDFESALAALADREADMDPGELDAMLAKLAAMESEAA